MRESGVECAAGCTYSSQYGPRMMSASANKIAVVALMFGLLTAIARANSPPRLDVGPTCNAAAGYAIAVGRTKESCLADEHAAESTLAENWSKYSAADKTQCIGTVNMGGPPSYVELLSCIEVLRDACGPDLAWVRGASSALYARPCDDRSRTDAVRRQWRLCAKAAGILSNVQNRDSRPGAATEAELAGAAPDTVRRLLGHARGETTEIYRRGNREVRSNIAKLRAEKRK